VVKYTSCRQKGGDKIALKSRLKSDKKIEKNFKKYLTKGNKGDIIDRLSRKREK